MSRIGNKEIQLPTNVQLEIKENQVTVKGPLGTLSQNVNPEIKVNVSENKVQVTRPSEQKRHKSLHGTTRALIANMVKGVSEGYKINLELIGVGFKSALQGNVLDLSIGFSHNIMFQLPKEVKIKTDLPKGGNPTIYLECIDKQLLGQVSAKIRGFRSPEPYKGKGIKYSEEIIRRKAGKTAAAKK